ncbi:MAG: response regulator transcription factor [Williamsia sp.]|nr:response regulator transcription factor [Williamsia sp.]
MSVKILYVEDELFLAKIVKESLETRGYQVALETDGDKAISLFRETSPDICVLDIMLPGMDGFDLAEEIRRIDSRIPIIFLTAKTGTQDVVKGFSQGGNDYIRKPFSIEELIVRIQHQLRDKGGQVQKPPTDTIALGTYTFQLNRQILSNRETERKLSFRESELLRLLYENRDRIIDRKEILHLIWGNDSFFNSRNLDVYITKLRSYLREDASLEIITIKGIGYRFVVV